MAGSPTWSSCRPPMLGSSGLSPAKVGDHVPHDVGRVAGLLWYGNHLTVGQKRGRWPDRPSLEVSIES